MSWSPEEVQVYLTKVKNALNDQSIHSYHRIRRVWAQKSLKAQLVEAEIEAKSTA